MLDWDPAPLPKKGAEPQFSAHAYRDQTAEWIKIALRMEVGLGAGHIMGTQIPSPKKGPSPQFSAHVCCGQTAVCIRIPLGTEVGIDDIVLDGDPPPFP